MLKRISVISTIVLLSAICQMQPAQKKSIYSSLSGSVDQMIRGVFTRIESWGDRFFDLIPFVGKKITRTQRRIIIMSGIITTAFVMGYLSGKARRVYTDALRVINRFDMDLRWAAMKGRFATEDIVAWDSVSFLEKLIWILLGKPLDDLHQRQVAKLRQEIKSTKIGSWHR